MGGGLSGGLTSETEGDREGDGGGDELAWERDLARKLDLRVCLSFSSSL